MNSLNDVCYEEIKNNFYYGILGDFKIIIDKKTEYINATNLCKKGGKDFKIWKMSDQFKELSNYYKQNIYNIKDENCKIISGTYIRKEFFLALSLWLSIDFYDKIYKIIEKQFISEFMLTDEDKLRKINNVEKKMCSLQLKNTILKDDKIPKSIMLPSKLNIFSIIKKNKDDSNYPYYVIRCQKPLFNKSIKDLKEKYPNMTIEHKIQYNHNIINFFNRIKENLPYIETRFNHLKVDDIEKLKSDIDKLFPELDEILPSKRK